MELQITVNKILDTQRFTSSKTGNEYVKNIFVGTTTSQYPKTVAFSVMGEEKFQQMGIAIGGQYNVFFDIESREWNGKFFTECNAWRVDRLDGSQNETKNDTVRQQQQVSQSPVTNSSNTSDLPF